MMHGEVNLDLLCSVIERILSERDDSTVKVTFVSKTEKEKPEDKEIKTA